MTNKEKLFVSEVTSLNGVALLTLLISIMLAIRVKSTARFSIRMRLVESSVAIICLANPGR
jgi:hypothetical protein